MDIHDVGNCARCGGDHCGVLFRPFTNAPKPYTHFGICPSTQEPILLLYAKPKRKKRK